MNDKYRSENPLTLNRIFKLTLKNIPDKLVCSALTNLETLFIEDIDRFSITKMRSELLYIQRLYDLVNYVEKFFFLFILIPRSSTDDKHELSLIDVEPLLTDLKNRDLFFTFITDDSMSFEWSTGENTKLKYFIEFFFFFINE